MKGYRVLVCGDRDWTDTRLVREALHGLPVGTILINGGARGADQIAQAVGRALGFWVVTYEPSSKMWPAAGNIRNGWMLDEGKPQAVIAFHDDLSMSRGTKDMVGKARAAGLPVRLISHGGEVHA